MGHRSHTAARWFRQMRDLGQTWGGDGLEERPVLWRAANPFADPFELRVVRLAKKVNAGADFIQTHIFDPTGSRGSWAWSASAGLTAGPTYCRSDTTAIGQCRQVHEGQSGGDESTDEIVDRMSRATDPKKGKGPGLRGDDRPTKSDGRACTACTSWPSR